MKQPRLGYFGLVMLVVLMSMFTPLSTDMYLPALPTIGEEFGVNPAIANLTVTFYFIPFCIGVLFWGPLSDGIGRKPALLAGGVGYVAGCIANVFVSSVGFMVAARVTQGLCASCLVSLSMALVNDCFEEEDRTVILSFVLAVQNIGPVAAPVLGGFVLAVAPWRYVFVILATLGVVTLVGTMMMAEPLAGGGRGFAAVSEAAYGFMSLAQHKPFIVPASVLSVPFIGYMSYLISSSYIYEDFFGLSQQSYSLFFAANAAVCAFGSIVYGKVGRRYRLFLGTR